MKDLENMNIKQLMEIAKQRVIDEVPVNTTFKVRDLFVGFKWDSLSVGMRKRMGLYFFVWADSEGSQYLSIDEKSTSGQQLYTRIWGVVWKKKILKDYQLQW